ncbi:alanine racemase, partial [Pseudomonas syringae pv. tagetis]|uniref:alanine racemase n=1 Tax=Pseudomonas syringae group genomosp. 7 TaxID=251699 RepID=UPI00376F5E5B
QSTWQLEAIQQPLLGKPITVWLKLDTGMHRVGLHPYQYQAAYERLMATGKVARIVQMSHFARADEMNSGCNDEQFSVFEAFR